MGRPLMYLISARSSSMYSSLSQHAYSRLTFLLLQNDPLKWKTDYVTERIDMGLSSTSPLEDSGKVACFLPYFRLMSYSILIALPGLVKIFPDVVQQLHQLWLLAMQHAEVELLVFSDVFP